MFLQAMSQVLAVDAEEKPREALRHFWTVRTARPGAVVNLSMWAEKKRAER